MKKLLIILFMLPLFAVAQLPYNPMYILAGQSVGGTTLKDGLISVWELNETSGTDVFDAHGSNDGVNSGATVNQTGVPNLTPAYDFNGSSDYITLPDIITNCDDISISLWFNLVDKLTRYTFINNFTTGTTGKWVTINYSSSTDDIYFEFDFGTGGGKYSLTYAGTNINTGTWYNVIGTRNKTTGDLFLYINGTSVDSELSAPTITNVFQNANNWRIGSQTGNQEYVNGKIDQTAVWNKVLTQTEITALYNARNGLPYTGFGIEWFILIIALRRRNYRTINNLKIAA